MGLDGCGPSVDTDLGVLLVRVMRKCSWHFVFCLEKSQLHTEELSEMAKWPGFIAELSLSLRLVRS